jgi:enoyl-CoA hydratase
MTSLVQYESDGTVSKLTMDDGKANVLSVRMLDELNAALDRAENEKTIVLLTGRENMFSGGFDLNVFKQGGKSGQLAMLKAGAETAERLLSFPVPVVIACGGHAIAMGAFLLLSSDVRIGIADISSKICVNEVQIGMTLPHFAIEICRQRLAPAHFNRATVTADPYNPQQAVDAGFLDYLVPAAELQKVAREKAIALSKLVRSAHTATKLRVRASALQALRGAIETDIDDWKNRPV